MAIRTGYPGVEVCHHAGSAGNLMLRGLVACLASHVLPAAGLGSHVHVLLFGGFFKGGIKTGMLYRISATAEEMAVAAVSARRHADTPGRQIQIHDPFFHGLHVDGTAKDRKS